MIGTLMTTSSVLNISWNVCIFISCWKFCRYLITSTRSMCSTSDIVESWFWNVLGFMILQQLCLQTEYTAYPAYYYLLRYLFKLPPLDLIHTRTHICISIQSSINVQLGSSKAQTESTIKTNTMRRLCFALVVWVREITREFTFTHKVFVGRGNSRRASFNCTPPFPSALFTDALLITLSHCLSCHFALHFHSPIILESKSSWICMSVCVTACCKGGDGVR